MRLHGYMTLDKEYCVPECPAGQEPVDGKCQCGTGFTLAADKVSCTCDDYLSLDRRACVTKCGLY